MTRHPALLRPVVALLVPLWVAACATAPTPAHGPGAANPAAANGGQAVAARPRTLQTLPPPSDAEARSGLQVAHIGVTASGGLIDARFKVLDAAKAKAALANPANAPRLLAGDTPPILAPHHALRGARFSQGQVFYIMYPNTRSAVKPGVDVSVALGDVTLNSVKAE
jgi:hypothetical protein